MCVCKYVELAGVVSIPLPEMFARILFWFLELIFFLCPKEDMCVKNLTMGYNLTEWHTQESDVIHKKTHLFSDMWVLWGADIDGKRCSLAKGKYIYQAVTSDLLQTKVNIVLWCYSWEIHFWICSWLFGWEVINNFKVHKIVPVIVSTW